MLQAYCEHPYQNKFVQLHFDSPTFKPLNKERLVHISFYDKHAYCIRAVLKVPTVRRVLRESKTET